MINDVIGMVSWRDGRGPTMENPDLPAREGKAAVGFVVSPAVAKTIADRFAKSRKTRRAVEFAAIPVVVDPDESPGCCQAFYCSQEWERRIAAIRKAP